MTFEGDIRFQILEELKGFRDDYLPGSGGGGNGGGSSNQLTAYSIGVVSIGASWTVLNSVSSSNVIIFNDSDFAVRVKPSSDNSGAYLLIGSESALSLPVLSNTSEWSIQRDDNLTDSIDIRYLSLKYGTGS